MNSHKALTRWLVWPTKSGAAIMAALVLLGLALGNTLTFMLSVTGISWAAVVPMTALYNQLTDHVTGRSGDDDESTK
jgi:uncharacterized membrane protein YraQ (UPF0718 family)